LSGALALGKRGVTCIPRQPLSFAPSSTSLCFLRALSGSTGWQWPVSWSTLGSLQLVGCVSGCQGGIRGGYSPNSPTRDVELRGVALAARPWPEPDLLPCLFVVGRFTTSHYPRMSVSHCGVKAQR
jgi:hypothetical protein